jgi:hypothetical protein
MALDGQYVIEYLTQDDLLAVSNRSSTSGDWPNDTLLWPDLRDYEHLQGFTSDEFKVESVVLVALYVPVFLLGIAGNSSLVILVLSKRQLRNVTNFYLMNLAFADLAGEYVTF